MLLHNQLQAENDGTSTHDSLARRDSSILVIVSLQFMSYLDMRKAMILALKVLGAIERRRCLNTPLLGS
jgi:hypothetical protein